MSISGIRSSTGYQANNSISEIDLQTLREAEQRVNLEKEELDRSMQSRESNTLVIPAREKQTFGAAAYADTYQPDKEYEMKGTESDIQNLDVQKAVSDMQKDRVIQQYQFFVGDSRGWKTEATAPAPLRGVEDFTV